MGRVIRGQRKGAGSVFTSNTSKRKGAAKHRQSVSEIYSRGVTSSAGFRGGWEREKQKRVLVAFLFLLQSRVKDSVQTLGKNNHRERVDGKVAVTPRAAAPGCDLDVSRDS